MVVERSNLTSATTDLCLREGGLCVIKSQCPQDKLASKKGLCGKADKECCHSRNNNKSTRTKFFVSNLIIAISFLRDTNNNTIITFLIFNFSRFGCWCVPSSARYYRRLPGTRRNVQVGNTFWPLFLVVVFSAIRIETNSMMNRR